MIHNQMEGHVVASYDTLRSQVPDFCGCDICRADVLVYALNRLPAKYVVSNRGAVLTDVNLDKDQSRARIDVVVLEALQVVAGRRRCGNPPPEF